MTRTITLDPAPIKRTVASAALAVLPKTGHLMNLEEPALFNHLLENFFHQVETGRGLHALEGSDLDGEQFVAPSD